MKNKYPIDSGLVVVLLFLLVVNLLVIVFSDKIEPILQRINSLTFNNVNSLLLLIVSLAITFMLFRALSRMPNISKDEIDRLLRVLGTHEALVQIQSDILPVGSRFYIIRKELMEIETSVNDGSIVIFARDISPDTQDPWLSVIRDNLQKGVQYIYILPDTQDARGMFESLEKKFAIIGDLKSKLIPLYIPDYLLISSITLYRSQEQGVLSIPNKHYEHKYYVTIEKEFFPLINRYIKVIEKTYAAARAD